MSKPHLHSFRFTPETHELLTIAPAKLTIAESKAVSKTEFVERAIREFVDRHNLKPKSKPKRK